MPSEDSASTTSVEAIAVVERRKFPRILASSTIRIDHVAETNMVNMSDGGLALESKSDVPMGVHKAALELAGKDIDLELDVFRMNRTGDSDVRVYGVKITYLNAEAQEALHKYMYASALDTVLKDMPSDSARKEVLPFAVLFREYICALMRLERQVASGASDKMSIQKELNELNNAIVLEGENLKGRLNDKRALDRVKHVFRNLAGSWAFKSQIMKRGFDKPKGYPGDYRTLEVIYNYETFSPENDLGFYFDWYFLANPYADAVRNRMGILREIITDTLKASDHPVKFLNLASGSCRELREIVQENDPKVTGKSATFSLIDWDDDALAFSAKALKNAPKSLKFDFIKEDIMNFIRDTSFFQKHGSYDLIYSIGLADYLPDRVLKKLIKNSYDNLNPGGKFIIAHKDKELSFSHLPPEWFCDWVFFPRNQGDMFQIISDAGLAAVPHEVRRDSTNQIFFISLVKD